jgi:hypothetical protein
MAISKSRKRPVSLNWQVVRQFVGCPYGFGEFNPEATLSTQKSLGKMCKI